VRFDSKMLSLGVIPCRALLPTPTPAAPQRRTAAGSSVEWVNPLQVDGFCEVDGWGAHEEPGELPLLVFIPGMDGSLITPFMQYPELGASYELACMQHVGLGLTLLVGESWGATLALGVLDHLAADQQPTGVVLVNPATSYSRSILSSVGPACAQLPQPLYALSLLLLAALVLEPAQLPAFVMLILALRQPALLGTPARGAFLGRVALSAILGVASGPRFAIGDLLRPSIFGPADLAFRLSEWLELGAAAVEPSLRGVRTPILLLAGERDRLLPSVEEAARLTCLLPPAVCRGTVLVPCAGHASTLGTQVDLAAEIALAFAPELGLPAAQPAFQHPVGPGVRAPTGAPNAESGIGAGWANGLIPRPYEPRPVHEYGEWNQGGTRCPVPPQA